MTRTIAFVPSILARVHLTQPLICRFLFSPRFFVFSPAAIQTNYSLVILAEGATDRVRRPIESAYLKHILSERLGHDTRVTCLGHVQRGGAPSADDRLQVSVD